MLCVNTSLFIIIQFEESASKYKKTYWLICYNITVSILI